MNWSYVGFTGFYWVLLGYTELFLVLQGFYKDWTGLSTGFTGFCFGVICLNRVFFWLGPVRFIKPKCGEVSRLESFLFCFVFGYLGAGVAFLGLRSSPPCEWLAVHFSLSLSLSLSLSFLCGIDECLLGFSSSRWVSIRFQWLRPSFTGFD